MRGSDPAFVGRYRDALEACMSSPAEDQLAVGYELGRTLLGAGVGLLQVVRIHQAALEEITSAESTAGDKQLLAHASQFLAECLSPFEMSLRGFQEANARLSGVNQNLANAHAELAAAHDHLKTEITERERAEAALLHAQKLQAVGLLAGGIAHHFNNLLTIVLGNLELARRRMAEDERLAGFLLAARRGAERGAEVTQQLLTFSRKQMLKPKVISLSEWLAEIKPLIASTLRGDITVEFAAAADVWPAKVDPAQLELALLNLAVNARDAMPNGGVLRFSCANVEMADERLGLDGRYVLLEIADTGEGVAPDLLPRIFEPFFTTKQAGCGTGLGLSQVHGFVHQSGGSMDVESALGTGTTIRLYLPASDEGPISHAGEAAPSKWMRRGGRLLVVEDDPGVAGVATDLLKSHGYSVHVADQPSAALQLLQDGLTVDLVFSDILMPGGMNGVQFAEEIRRQHPELPILLASGYSDALSEAAAAGFNVMTKPYQIDDLIEKVSSLLKITA